MLYDTRVLNIVFFKFWFIFVYLNARGAVNVYDCRLDFASAARSLNATHSPQAHIHIRTRFSNVLEIFLVLFLYIRVLFFSFFL